MSPRNRIIIAVLLILGVVILILGVTFIQRQAVYQAPATGTPLPPGSIPIYYNGSLAGGFKPDDLSKMQKVQFTDTAEGKLQDGWLLRDVILLYVPAAELKADAQIVVSSTSRNKSVTLTWAEVQDPTNLVMFDLTNRGTLKLASLLPQLDSREEWIQDADKIEITSHEMAP
jgi:hypothetical protein